MRRTRNWSDSYTVGPRGRTWHVYLNGELLEGGFFTKAAAEDARDEYLSNADYEEYAGTRARDHDREDFHSDG